MAAYTHGIRLKKKFGQHFLRDTTVVDAMIHMVTLTDKTSVFEIGPGDGFLTRRILAEPIARLWAFEIDPDWVQFLSKELDDQRFTVFQQNVLELTSLNFESFGSWTILANLPYQVTFPILYLFVSMRHLISEGVVMVQDEVAQKVVRAGGRGYGFPSLYLQYYFSWTLGMKVAPTAFEPPPKVTSRLLYFKPNPDLVPIPDQDRFWQFVKVCLRQPRRTLRNNLIQAHYNISGVDDTLLTLRAQQLDFNGFLSLWVSIK